jgi:hypothetical protein
MTRSDIQILFTALGFLTVVMKGENTKRNGAKQAMAMASLIQAFCQTSHPDLFGDEAKEAELDQLIEDMKDEELHITQLADLTGDKGLLYRVYDRLLQRHKDYATDEMIAGEVAHFLEEEISRKKEDKNNDCQRSGGYTQAHP